MLFFNRLFLCCVIVLAGALALAAAPVRGQHATELDAIRTLSHTSTLQALTRLEALKERVGKDAPYALRRDLLRTEVMLRDNAGQLDQVYALERQALLLAIDNNDPVFAALARLGAVHQLLDQNRPHEAQDALAEIRAGMPTGAPAMLRIAVDSAEGDVFNAKAQFDKALAAYLRALAQQQDDAADGESRAELLAHIARVYINVDNPDKAIETTRQALLDRSVPARSVGRLQFTQGIALLKQGNGKEGIAAFNSALDTATHGSLPKLEAEVRGNIADYFLRQQDYPRAEQEARLALRASEQVKDENMILMANANLGFALMGQKRFADGLPYVDAVIAKLDQAGSTTDLFGMLDEKGRMQEQAGLYKEALATVRRQQTVQQSGERAARDRAVAALQEEYEAGQRTRQIALLRRENLVKDAELHSRRLLQLLTTAGALLIVAAGAFVLVLYRRSAGTNVRLNQLNTQLTYHSQHDALTGLYNRRFFLDRMALRSQHERGDAEPRSVDCIVLMDIDHFKHINDRWGHGVGDMVLVEVARRLGAAVRESDMVMRWGGEEFLVYAPAADPAHVTDIVARVLGGTGATPIDAGTCSMPVTLTAGVVTLPLAGGEHGTDESGGTDWEHAIRLADWALYQGKAHGRNQACIVSGLLAPLVSVLAALEGDGTNVPGLIETTCVPGPAQHPD